MVARYPGETLADEVTETPCCGVQEGALGAVSGPTGIAASDSDEEEEVYGSGRTCC